MDDLNARVGRVHSSKAQIHAHLLGPGSRVLGQDRHLLQLLIQCVAVVGVAGEAARTDHQALLMRDCHADFHAELVGLPGLALSDALDLGGMQSVQLVLVLGLLVLAADALGALQQRLQIRQRQCRCFARLRDLARHLAQHDSEDRALAFDHLAQALELLGVGVATGTAAQVLAFPREGLLEYDARTLGRGHYLVASLSPAAASPPGAR